MRDGDDGPGALDAVLASARLRLDGVPREALGELVAARRVLGFRRAARIVRAGDAWHLGVLLLTDDRLLVTGEIVRARQEAVRGFAAESQRRRAELAAAARRGGFAEGEAVHVGWEVVDAPGLTDRTEPVAVREGVPVVRWSPRGGQVALAGYLDERIALLQHPPERA